MYKNGGLVYVADADEFEIACEASNCYLQDKIPQLLQFLETKNIFLETEDSKVYTTAKIYSWFTENAVEDSTALLLLVHHINETNKINRRALDIFLAHQEKETNKTNPKVFETSVTIEALLQQCKSMLRNHYRSDLVEQYEPLIRCTLNSADEALASEVNGMSITGEILRNIWINGRKIPLTRKADISAAVAMFVAALEATGLNAAMIAMLKKHLRHTVKAAYFYHNNMLKKIAIQEDEQCMLTYLDCNTVKQQVIIRVVRIHRTLYRMATVSATTKSTTKSPEKTRAPITAQSTIIFCIAEPSEEGNGVTLCGGEFEVYDSYVKSIIVRDLAKYYEKNIVSGHVLDINSQIITDQYLADCSQLTDTGEIINKLIANKSPLRIFLAARINRSVLRRILDTHELLICLCASRYHRDYLQYLKCLYSKDSEVSHDIAIILGHIDHINKCTPEMNCAEIANYFNTMQYSLALREPGVLPAHKGKIYLEREGKALRYTLLGHNNEVESDVITMKELPALVGKLPPLEARITEMSQFSSMGHFGKIGKVSEPIDLEVMKPLLPEIVRIARERDKIRETKLSFLVATFHILTAQVVKDAKSAKEGEEKNQFLLLLLNNERIRSDLEGNWIIGLAMASEQVATWVFQSGLISRLKLTSQQLCELLRMYPGLWQKIQKIEQSEINELPSHLLQAEQLQLLLLNNRERASREQAALAVCGDDRLFHRFRQLEKTCPDDLLRYFDRSGALFRSRRRNDYQDCEYVLLRSCDESIIGSYFYNLFCSLDKNEFSHKFVTNYLLCEYPNGSEMMLRRARIALISSLLRRIRVGDSIGDSRYYTEKMEQIVQMLPREPRLACLLKVQDVRSYLAATTKRQYPKAFVSCVMLNQCAVELNDPDVQISALSLFSSAELTDFLSVPMNALFMVNLLIKDSRAIGILLDADVEMDFFLTTIATEVLLLMMIALAVRQNRLEVEITQQESVFRVTGSVEIKSELQSKRQELADLESLRNQTLTSSKYLEYLQGSSNAIDFACLINFHPDIISKLVAEGSYDAHRQTIIKACQLIRPPLLAAIDKSLWRSAESTQSLDLLIDKASDDPDNAGINSSNIVATLKELITREDKAFFNTLLNGCLLAAFADNSIVSGIITTPELLDFVVMWGDLRLVAKFICLFGKLVDSHSVWLPFYRRLIDQPDLLNIYRPLLDYHFSGSSKCLFNTYVSAADLVHHDKDILGLVQQGEFQIEDFVCLLLLDYKRQGDLNYRSWLIHHPGLLERVIVESSTAELVGIFIGELTIRHHSAHLQPSLIEIALRAEPLLTEILRLSDIVCLIDLLRLDSTLAQPLLKVCQKQIASNITSDHGQLFWQQLCQSASVDQLLEIYSLCEGNNLPVNHYLVSMKDLVVLQEAHQQITLTPIQLVNLLIIAQQVDPNKTIQSDWGGLLQNNDLIYNHIFCRLTPPRVILKAIPIMLEYLPASRSLVEAYMERSRFRDLLEIADADAVVDFLVSEPGTRLVFPNKPASPQPRILTLICQLFLSCSEVQLMRLAQRNYVKILIVNFDLFSSDNRVTQRLVVAPRIIFALQNLFEDHGSYVEGVFTKNSQLVNLVNSSKPAMCVLLGSLMYHRSKIIQDLFNVQPGLEMQPTHLDATASPARDMHSRSLDYSPADVSSVHHRHSKPEIIAERGSCGDSEHSHIPTEVTRK